MIYVDTSFWIAAAVEPDEYHDTASELLSQHAGAALATSNDVIGETWTFVRRKFGHRLAVGVIDRIERTPRLRTIRIDEETEREAWRWLRDRDEREYSFVDATSFALMRSLRIREAFAFDGDFTAAGFVELRPV